MSAQAKYTPVKHLSKRLNFTSEIEYERFSKILVRELRRIADPRFSATLVKNTLARVAGFNNYHALKKENNTDSSEQFLRDYEGPWPLVLFELNDALRVQHYAKTGYSDPALQIYIQQAVVAAFYLFRGDRPEDIAKKVPWFNRNARKEAD